MLKEVASLVVGVGGVLYTAITSTFRVHMDKEYWTRIGTVNSAPGWNFYRSGRTRAWNLVEGPLGWDMDRTRVLSDNVQSDFNDVLGLMRKTADNYFSSVHNLW